MDGRGLLIFGAIALLCCSGWIIPQIGPPYCYPKAVAVLAVPRVRWIVGRRRFWTSGFV